MSNLDLEADIFNMSDEEFAQWEQGSSTQPEESTEVDSFDSEEEELDTQEDFEEEESEDESEEEELESAEDTDGTTDGDTDLEETSEVEQDTFDFETEYKKLIGSPIKANGREVTVDSAEDAVRLMQMGMNYSKKMEELKPAQRVIAMLESNGMLDEDKLSYAIDLINKNPQAINKLVAESGIDKYDLDEEQSKDYKPTDYSVSEQQVALDNALKDIASTPTYARTVNVLGKEWDNASRDIIKNNPEVIGILNTHMADGTFDTVQQEVEKRRMFGTLPTGISNLEAYKLVGDSLYAQAPSATGQYQEQANVRPPIQKPSKETVVRQKKAASTPRNKSPISTQMEDVFNMSDEDFMKKYNH